MGDTADNSRPARDLQPVFTDFRTHVSAQRWLKTGSVNVLRIRAAIQDNLHDLYWKTAGKIHIKAA